MQQTWKHAASHLKITSSVNSGLEALLINSQLLQRSAKNFFKKRFKQVIFISLSSSKNFQNQRFIPVRQQGR